VVEFFIEQAGIGVVVPGGEGAAGVDGDALVEVGLGAEGFGPARIMNRVRLRISTTADF
jgi:hypothetical protein